MRAERQIETEPGHSVRVIDSGGDLPPLVLLHGYTGSGDDWNGVITQLAEVRRVIALDHRGHGDSSHYGSAVAYTFDRLLADFEMVVTALQLDSFDLLGHSMGGVIAMRYVLDHPHAVRSLILMDTSPAPMGMPAEIVEQLVTVARTDGMAVLFERISQFAGSTEVDPVAQAAFARMDPEAFANLAIELDTYPSLLADLATVTCPTTVIVGDGDHTLIAPSEAMAAAIAGARLVVIADAGHNPHQDQPQAWTAAVLAHLESGD